MTRGHRGSLLLRCWTLSFLSTCRFIPALYPFTAQFRVHKFLFLSAAQTISMPLWHQSRQQIFEPINSTSLPIDPQSYQNKALFLLYAKRYNNGFNPHSPARGSATSLSRLGQHKKCRLESTHLGTNAIIQIFTSNKDDAATLQKLSFHLKTYPLKVHIKFEILSVAGIGRRFQTRQPRLLQTIPTLIYKYHLWLSTPGVTLIQLPRHFRQLLFDQPWRQ